MLEMITNLVLIPAIVSGLAALLASSIENERIAHILLTIGIVLGFTGSYIAIAGIPPFPPKSSVQKLFYAPILAGVVLIILHLVLGKLSRTLSIVAFVLSLAGSAWIIQRLIGRLDGMEWLLVAGLIATIVLAFLTTTNTNMSLTAARVAHGACALGLGLVLIIGGTATTGFYAIALAIAVGATLLFDITNHRHTAIAAVSAAFLIAATPLATQTLLLTDVAPLALLPLPLCYLAPIVARRLDWGNQHGLFGTVLDSVKIALVAFPPAFAAAGISFASGGGSPY